jgi:hypothetical protein
MNLAQLRHENIKIWKGLLIHINFQHQGLPLLIPPYDHHYCR